jgi:hypothetical protein
MLKKIALPALAMVAAVIVVAGLCSGQGAAGAASPKAPAATTPTDAAPVKAPAEPAPAAKATETKAPEAAPAAGSKEVRLLAIGNSFSGDATRHLPGLVKAAGHTLVFGHASIGGCPLAKHWALAEAHEKDPADAKGKPYTYNGNKVSLKELLTAQKWQYVTIQQFSGDSYKIDTYRPHAKNLYDYIKKHAPQAEVLVHQTWAYREDDPIFQSGKFTQQQMFDGLRAAYQTIASELKCRIIPVGTAMQRVRHTPEWKFVYPDPKFDYAGAKSPALPSQEHSLNVGWRWSNPADGQPKLSLDAHHASLAGQYLGAAVWFEFLYGQSVVDNTYVPAGLQEADAAFLRKMAHEAVAAAKSVP